MPIFFLSNDSFAIVIVPVIYSDCGNKIDLILMTPTSDESNIATLA